MRFAVRKIQFSLCALALLASWSCHSSKSTGQGVSSLRHINVVLVTIDTLRPDRLGCYGDAKVETPNLDRLAQKGVLFEHAITPTPLTAPSHASMFTGTYPTVHRVRDTGGFVLQPSNLTLAKILQQQGWDTAAFVGASVLKKAFGFGQGFAVYDDEMPNAREGRTKSQYPERRAGEVVDRAVAWLQSQSGKPYFLWVHVFDPHTPYDPPSPFREKYSGRPYDGEVAYTDQQLGRLFDAVAKKSPADQTIIAVLSDHGESLGEHGEFTHGVFLYDSTVRVAFLLDGPGVPSGLRVKQQVRTIDLVPTLLELMGGHATPRMQGASLVPALAGKQLPAASSFEETLYPKINMGWTELRGIRTNHWKYIRAPKPELYDLASDPGETNNLIATHDSQVQALEAQLKAVIGSGAEKIETDPVDQQTVKQLKSLGYLGGYADKEYALTGKGIDPKDRTDVLELLHRSESTSSRDSSTRIALLRRALAEDPADPSVYFQLGDEYARAGQSGEAMKLYQQGIRNGVHTSWIYSRLGYLYIQQGNRDQAIPLYETSIRLNPSDCETLNDLGMAYVEAGRLADADRVLHWCVATGDRYAPVYNVLGLVSIRKQDLTAARGYFEKAVQFDPDLLEAQLNLGRIYRMIGADTKARACFETFLAKASPSEYGAIIPKIKAELAAMR